LHTRIIFAEYRLANVGIFSVFDVLGPGKLSYFT